MVDAEYYPARKNLYNPKRAISAVDWCYVQRYTYYRGCKSELSVAYFQPEGEPAVPVVQLGASFSLGGPPPETHSLPCRQALLS